MSKTDSGGHTVLRVDGLLQADDVPTLSRECAAVGGPLTLDLSQLKSADERGVEAIHALVSRGTELRGLSPYLELLLLGSVNQVL